MYIRILPLLIFGFLMVTYADSAVQTDWSGGPGVMGAVIEWGDQFFYATYIRWSVLPGNIVLQPITEHTVEGNFNGANCIYSEDIDGDGDMDILGTAYIDDDITWWENSDTSPGIYWTEHTIDADFNNATSVYSEDIDGDGDMDVLGTASADDDIIWWENIDGSGTSWTEHIIDGDVDGAKSAYSEDIDGDGDMDVLGTAWVDDYISWWENEDSSGTSWIEHTVDGSFIGPISAYSEDIDDDGDMDILGAGYIDKDITWWENIDGLGTSWAEHTVDGNFDGAYCVYSEDINGDGYMDILGTAYNDDDITWWENEDGSGTSWIEHTVVGDFNGASFVYSEDIDGDGDMDILGTAYNDDDIIWWENEDGSGTSWIEHIVDWDFDGANFVYSEDIDGDGYMDILGTAYNDDDITWWDLTAYSVGSLISSVLDTQGEPSWDYLDWNSQTPPGTNVSFQIRASNDYLTMGDWSDTLTSPCLLAGILNDGDRYVQYKAILSTSDPDTTPMLNDVTITWNPFGVEDDPQVTEYLLFGAEPNPACGIAHISFAVPELSSVELLIFDLSGHLMATLVQGEYSPGVHEAQIDELTPGIYFCRMTSEQFTTSRKFVVIQ